jgi:hypothetical protein
MSSPQSAARETRSPPIGKRERSKARLAAPAKPGRRGDAIDLDCSGCSRHREEQSIKKSSADL